MTATERLRQLLDERGVEWRKTPHYSSDSIDNETVFRGVGEIEAYRREASVAIKKAAQAKAENEKLRELCHEMLAVIIGWGWKFNELSGHKPEAEGTYPTETMHSFISMARELGVQL